MQRSILLFTCCLMMIVHSCTPKYSKFNNKYIYLNKKEGQPDYSDLYNWAAHPYKHDPSDSIPRPLKNSTRRDSTVDVFFLHPTTFTSREDTGWNADIFDATINAKTDYSSILYQASAFNEWRVFAPRYRQAHIRSYYTADSAGINAFNLAYEDIRQSFIYYLEHFNQGRPIIIASHSQGSTHAQRLLKEFFEHSELTQKLIAAYVIGMYIPSDYFSELKLCQDAKATGCVIGWRTYKNGYVPSFVQRENTTSMIVNPLSWKPTSEYAGYKMNKGTITTKFNHLYKNATDAQIYQGVLWINRPRIPGSRFLKIRNFHVGDINLFYVNIRDNLRARVAAYRSMKAK